ncbi:MAG: zf-HC2 domain-containing protein [Candidatus Aminicenantes bacterium]|nr:MAG: zf-HC2 domain-containing protein [Candidatus Aminicenantes bacterium]
MTCKEFASLIDSYLRGNLSAEKHEAFELHYFECDGCFAQLKVSERLHSKEVPIIVESKKPVFEWARLWTWKPLLAAAAALLVLVLSSIFVIQHSKHMKLIYDISTFSPPVYLKSETRGPETIETFAEAMQYYNQGDYTRALKILKQIPPSSRNPQVIFFKGVCFLLVDELKDAIKEFDIIIGDMNPSYYDETIYYKAIALLRMNKKDRALEQLIHLAGMFSPYAPKARELTRKVNNI